MRRRPEAAAVERVAAVDWREVASSLDERGYATTAALLTTEECRGLAALYDRDEAFRSHPRIGETRTAQPSHARSAAWSALEQQKAALTGEDVKIALAEGNQEYERRFNRIFIVCASGKTAPEILEILRRRLQNDPEVELREAVEQQRQIMHLRIKRWLGE